MPQAEAITRWSYAYADQSLRDFKKLAPPADEGRVSLANITGARGLNPTRPRQSSSAARARGQCVRRA
jgi:hypothetical protein